METQTKNKGQVLLVSYTDSQFMEICRKNRGCYILDNRAKGWSSNPALRAETLKEAFGNRYQMVPSLGINSGEGPEDYLTKATPVIAKIAEVLEDGRSVIITGFSSGLLKIIGNLVICAKEDARVFMKWEKDEDGGISRQRKMDVESFNAKLTKICELQDTFHPENNEDFDEDFVF